MFCCMCEPMETAQSLGDDPHAVGTQPKWAREHGPHSLCGPLLSVGCKPGPSTGARTRDAGKRERKTPDPLLNHTHTTNQETTPNSRCPVSSSLFSLLSSRSSHLSSSRLSPNSHILLLTSSSFSLYRPDFPIFFAPLLQPLVSFSCFSPLISPPPLLPIFECCCVSRHQGDTYQVAFSFLFSSPSSLPLHSSLPWPFFPSLAFLLFCPSPCSRLSRSLLSPLMSPPSLHPFLPVRHQASGDNFLAANFEVGALATCSDMPFCPQTAKPPNPPQLCFRHGRWRVRLAGGGRTWT